MEGISALVYPTLHFLADNSSTFVICAIAFSCLSFWNASMTQQSRDIAIKEPRPKWEVLSAMNYIIMAVFIASTSYVALNYNKTQVSGSNPLAGILPAFMICLCLAYFFGFFGITFIDRDTLSDSPSTYGLSEVERQAEAAKESHKKESQANSLQPRHDAPICCEKPSATVAAAPVTAATEDTDFTAMSDEEVLGHLLAGSLKDHQLEKKLADTGRAVAVRRMMYESLMDRKLDLIPHEGYDYDKVFGANCEIVVGYVPLPVGLVGPLLLNGQPVYVPMATTEGCLVASTNRGCKAITASGGAQAVVLKDAITRAPCLRLPSAMRAAAVKIWTENKANYARLEEAFNSTTSFGMLESITATIAGRNIFLRFCCMSGDAMGMNMVSKGCLKAIEVLENEFPDITLVAISGNMCTDKKPAAINWILGRGKSVVVEAVIPERVVKSVLKTTVQAMIETNKQKNHVGSAMAASVGGFNAHASNVVSAVFLATGQDPAQNVESSNCITIMELAEDESSLHVSVTMPSIEVGTVGGGTHLPAQAGCLEVCGVRGASRLQAGDNARQLAQIVGAAVLAGELSLMAALAANHLVRSHMQHNRKPKETTPSPAVVQASILRKNESAPNLAAEE